MSTDKKSRLEQCRDKLGAQFAFVPNGKELALLYGVKTPLLPLAKRYTFVIGKERKILSIDSGGKAIDPNGALDACSLY